MTKYVYKRIFNGGERKLFISILKLSNNEERQQLKYMKRSGGVEEA